MGAWGCRAGIQRGGKPVTFTFPLVSVEKSRLYSLVYPHMLRHAYGYKLANKGVATEVLHHYLGQKNI